MIVMERVLKEQHIVETIGVGTDRETMLFETTDVVVDTLTDLAIDGGADAPCDGFEAGFDARGVDGDGVAASAILSEDKYSQRT